MDFVWRMPIVRMTTFVRMIFVGMEGASIQVLFEDIVVILFATKMKPAKIVLTIAGVDQAESMAPFAAMETRLCQKTISLHPWHSLVMNTDAT